MKFEESILRAIYAYFLWEAEGDKNAMTQWLDLHSARITSKEGKLAYPVREFLEKSDLAPQGAKRPRGRPPKNRDAITS